MAVTYVARRFTGLILRCTLTYSQVEMRVQSSDCPCDRRNHRRGHLKKFSECALWLIFAARMKSLSVRPLILCVHTVISTFPHARKMSGWCPCSSASSPTRFTNLSASRKLGNLKVFVMWCSSITLHPSTCFCKATSSSPLSGGTPPRHGTHALAERSNILEMILALPYKLTSLIDASRACD